MGRINRAIELLEAGQPVYMTGGEGGGYTLNYQGGKEAAQTWADYLVVDMEHSPLDIPALREFMRGLVDGGPTRSGHRTPPIVVTLPIEGSSEQIVRANAWMIRQVLFTGVHGLLLCHAEVPEAVRAFVEAARYPFNRLGVGEGLNEGRRGNAGQASAAAIWGIPVDEYLYRADVWPLNPRGELMLGLKIENKRALANAEATTKVPGIAFAEWGPGDMGMSLGFSERHDPPYPPEMLAARDRVLAACQAAKIAFEDMVEPDTVIERIREGVMIESAYLGPEAAEIGRRYTGRTLPW